MMQTINVVLATDLGYLFQTIVTIESILLNNYSRNEYIIHILTNADLYEHVKYLEEKYENCKIVLHFFDDEFDNYKISINHISKVTYFRLLIPERIHEKKCIYLDSDIIVKEDLVQLYSIDINDYEIGGVYAPSYHHLNEREQSYSKETGICSFDQYINAGVLLMNLEKMRENRFIERVNKVAKCFSFPSQDQDIINNVCYGKIKPLPLKYNYASICSAWDYDKKFAGVFSKNEVEQAKIKPSIVHFSCAAKPWEVWELDFALDWWKVCKCTPIFDLFLDKYKKSAFYHAIYKGMFASSKPFSEEWYDRIRKQNIPIYIYGAGKYANNLIKSMESNAVDIQGILVSDISIQKNKCIERYHLYEFDEKIDKEALIILGMNDQNMLSVRRKLLEKGYYNLYWSYWITMV